MGIAHINESAKDYAKTWETACYIQAKRAIDVVVACEGDVFIFFMVHKELCWTNLEEKVEVDIDIDEIDEELNGQQKVDESQLLSLLK